MRKETKFGRKSKGAKRMNDFNEEEYEWEAIGSGTAVFRNKKTGEFSYFSGGNESNEYIENVMKQIEPFKNQPYNQNVKENIIKAIEKFIRHK